MTGDFVVPTPGQEALSAMNELTRQFAAPDSDSRWGVYHGRDDGGPLSLVGNWIEQSVFRELYFQTAEDVAAAYGLYSAQTIWTVIVHHPSQRAVGATRCLVGPARELMSAVDIERYWGKSWDESCAVAGADPDDRFIEAASFSVLPEWRTSDRMWPVKVACSTYMHLFEDVGADWAVQIINPSVKRLFESWGTPFVSIGEPRELIGATFEPTMLKRQPGRPYFKTRDREYLDLMQERDEQGRGGTRLPVIDLDRQSLIVQIDEEARTRAGEGAQP